MKQEVFPTLDNTPSSLHDADEDNSWLDEPHKNIVAEVILVTSLGPINMACSILTQMLADEPFFEAADSEQGQEDKASQEQSLDNDFTSAGWI